MSTEEGAGSNEEVSDQCVGGTNDEKDESGVQGNGGSRGSGGSGGRQVGV